MEFFVDSGDLQAIRSVADYFPIDGFTTNPNLLTQSDEPLARRMEAYRDCAAAHNWKVFVQVTAQDAVQMHRQAARCREYFGNSLIVKIPATRDGYRALSLCAADQIPTLCTVIHSMPQALLAAKAGAAYVAPYVSHIDNIGADGIGTVDEMVQVFREYGYACKVLGASFRNADQIRRLALVGCHAVTLPPAFFDLMIHHPSTDESMEMFTRKWSEHFGDAGVDNFLNL